MTDESVEVTHIKYANGRWFAKLGDSGKHFEIVNAAKSFPNHFQQAKRDRGQWVNVEAGAKWVVSKMAFKKGAHKKGAYQIIYEGFEGQPYDVLDGKLAPNLRFWGEEAALRPGNYVTVLPVVEVCVDAEGLWWAYKAQKITAAAGALGQSCRLPASQQSIKSMTKSSHQQPVKAAGQPVIPE